LASRKTTPAAIDPFAAVAQAPAAQALRSRLETEGVWSLGHVAPAAQPFLVAFLRTLCPNRPIVAVTDGLKSQEAFHQDVQTWLAFRAQTGGQSVPDSPARPPLFYPAWETLPHEAKLPHADVISERLETLVALSHWQERISPRQTAAVRGQAPAAPLVVTCVQALLQRTFPPEVVAARTRTLRRGDRLSPLDLIEWLEEHGYESEVQVTHKGEIALRGGIVDVFPLTQPWPVRLEFFGDELESLRFFDPISQLSRESLEAVTIPPGGELGLLKRALGPAKLPESKSSPLTSPDAAKPTRLATLREYLPAGSLFIFCQPDQLAESAVAYAELVPAADPFFVDWDAFATELKSARFNLLSVSDTAVPEREPAGEAGPEPSEPPADPAGPSLRFESLEAFRPVLARAPDPVVAERQRRDFFAQMHGWSRRGISVQVFCNNDGERQRFMEVWQEYGLEEPAGSESGRSSGPLSLGAGFSLQLGSLSGGFLCEAARLAVITDAEVFGRYKVQRPRRLKSPHAQTSRSLLEIDFADLEEGDYVVHLQHGIGRYLGLQRMAGKGGSKPLEKAAATFESEPECLVIEYAPNDPDQPAPRLFVPLSEAHLVSKYVGAGKARPPLNTLGGGRWQKTKEHAERAVRDLAAELLSVQAARASQAGYGCKADTPWQREFESAFLYEETPDQWRAIVATKQDMESSRPMDRLICGDVGYGKTEVAIRAAFKSVMDGKQVAILVPTTVLAQQHFNTFRERMADYPVRIELLSRFRTPREQRKVVQDLASGAVDIVIGTHRLVQDDIAFKDLALVVIDEEQRFGVLHKEKFKLLRRLVDVLTLSATPIPRTLYLALTGARDMSTIETPPQDRLPVETIVTEYDERIIRDAIVRELARGGQVFYLHNRVGDIEDAALRLRALVPKARLVVGHGQMHADDLEEVMTRFVNGEADVLLSTTIIESGIDIPNANTIIIDRADRFGLSDLYQLRGRVGRYKHQAYAYLLVPRHARLLTDARKRISAIKQYSSLGSGFKIAMRDLEIRGAGNLLGPQQSGHITAVGFELYCQLLKQSVAQLKGEKVAPRLEVQVRLDFLSLNPDEQADDPRGPKARASRGKSATTTTGSVISVPRETTSYVEAGGQKQEETPPSPMRVASACIPTGYVTDPKQRIDVYRKLASIGDQEGVGALKAELRDRFGPLPPAVELLLQVTELKLEARLRGIEIIETKDGKLMLTRRGDFLMVGGKFPRLTKKEPRARLNEIKRMLQVLR
jgi:transcription-repair coupling factor (superfamily II helicase)